MSIRTLTQEDPIGLAGGLNLYGFAGGDPINFSDPFGLCPEEETGRPCKEPTEENRVRTGGVTGEVGSFGLTRRYGDGTAKPHHGIDFLGEEGDAITAADEGVVVARGSCGDGYGSCLVLGHENDAGAIVSYTLYAHLQSIDQAVGSTGRVSAGQRLGSMGRSGVTNPTIPTHLHFEILRTFPARRGVIGLEDRWNPARQLSGRTP